MAGIVCDLLIRIAAIAPRVRGLRTGEGPVIAGDDDPPGVHHREPDGDRVQREDPSLRSRSASPASPATCGSCWPALTRGLPGRWTSTSTGSAASWVRWPRPGAVDGALVFTAGVGEPAAAIRARVCRDAAWLGVTLDEAANEADGPRISRKGGVVSAWVVPTDEELMIARQTSRLTAP